MSSKSNFGRKTRWWIWRNSVWFLWKFIRKNLKGQNCVTAKNHHFQNVHQKINLSAYSPPSSRTSTSSLPHTEKITLIEFDVKKSSINFDFSTFRNQQKQHKSSNTVWINNKKKRKNIWKIKYQVLPVMFSYYILLDNTGNEFERRNIIIRKQKKLAITHFLIM